MPVGSKTQPRSSIRHIATYTSEIIFKLKKNYEQKSFWKCSPWTAAIFDQTLLCQHKVITVLSPWKWPFDLLTSGTGLTSGTCGLSTRPTIYRMMLHLADSSVNPSRTWWRHQMETFSALLAICTGNSPVTGEFPTQRPVTRSFQVFFGLRLNKRLSKESWGWWFETLSCSLWRHIYISNAVTFSWFLC